MGPSPSLDESRVGMRLSATYSQIGGSRKNAVTLMRITSNRYANSSWSTCRKSRYAPKLSTCRASMRLRTRRIRLARLYPEKSNPRLSFRYCRRSSNSGSTSGAFSVSPVFTRSPPP